MASAVLPDAVGPTMAMSFGRGTRRPYARTRAAASMMPANASTLRLAPPTRRAVDLLALHELRDVVRRDAAAVEDAHGLGLRVAEHRGDFAADEGDRLLGVVGGGGAAGADRPDGLVGDDEAVGDARVLEPGARLADEDRLHLAGLALVQRLADAHDRLQADVEHGLHLAVHGLVGLAEDVAALGVADDHVVDELLELLRADLAGGGDVVLPVHVLRAEANAAHRDRGLDGGEVDERRADDLLDALDLVDALAEVVGELVGGAEAHVALPVAGDDGTFAYRGLSILRGAMERSAIERAAALAGLELAP